MALYRRWAWPLRWMGAFSTFLPDPPETGIRQFVLMTSPRSGSTWVTDLLDSHPDIVCFSEVFAHDHFGNMPDGGCHDVTTWDSYSTLRLPELGRWGRLRLYFEFLDQEIYSSRHNAAAVGFKMMYRQAQRGFGIPAYLKIRNVCVVHLIRFNHLDVLLSEEAVRARKYHHAAPGTEVVPVRITLEPRTLAYRLEQREQMIRQARESYSGLGLPYLEVAYEDLRKDVSVILQCLQFLGVEADLEKLSCSTRKLNPDSHRDAIVNYDEVERALRDTRFADLLH